MHHITSLCLPFWLKTKDKFVKLHAPTLDNDVINKVIMLGLPSLAPFYSALHVHAYVQSIDN